MADSLKTLLMDQLTELHDAVVAYLDDHSPRDVLGEDLDQLRSTGTGKSLVMLALLDDLLRITEIVLDQNWNPLEPRFAEFSAPFFQSAAKMFHRKGLKQYAPFVNLDAANAGRFLEFHANSGQPFGGHHKPTEWSGLRICTNVASRFEDLAIVEGYEQLTQTLLKTLVEWFPKANSDGVQQVAEFLSDRCGDVRDQIRAVQQSRQPEFQALTQERAELIALRSQLDAREAQLGEREQIIQQEWKRFQQERAEFEQLRQQWEERLEELTGHSKVLEQLANERETLAIERAALNSQRQQLEAAQPELEQSRQANAESSADVAQLQQEKIRLAEDRRKLEEDRAALWNEREELAALREQLLSERNPPEAEDHILFDLDSSQSLGDGKAAVMTTSDANELLQSAAFSGDAEQVQAALKWGADVNTISAEQNWQTPLHLAARQGHIDILEILLDAGADAERTDAESFNPLESAVINEQPEAARLLVDRVPACVAQAYPLLLRIMRDPKSPVLSRRLSIEAIGTLKGEATDSIPTLLNLLESEARELGQAAAEALQQVDPDVLPVQAIPYVSYILDGPLVKKNTTDPHWVSNLYAVRGDLCRLAGRTSEALKDYEAALSLAAAEQRPKLRQLLDDLESQNSAAHSSNTK